MGIEKYLFQLLFEHECVIVPGFGAFIKNYQPATIQPGTHIFFPPKQYLVFNSGLTINDGLLATQIATGKQVSFEEAMVLIRRDVVAWRERMRAGKKVTLLDIGQFYFSKEEKIIFEPDLNVNFMADIYGMTSIVAPPLAKKEKGFHALSGHSNKRFIKPAPARVKVLLRAAAITIPLVVATLWATLNQDTIGHFARQSASTIMSILESPEIAPKSTPDAFVLSEKGSAESKENPDEITVTTSPNVSNHEPIISSDATDVVSPETHPQLTPKTLEIEKGYHIIIGSFSKIANANHLSQQFISQGYNALVIPGNEGMYRVSLTSNPSLDHALALLTSLRKQSFPDAWLLRL